MRIEHGTKSLQKQPDRRSFLKGAQVAGLLLVFGTSIRDSMVRSPAPQKPLEAYTPEVVISPEFEQLVGSRGVETTRRTVSQYSKTYGCPHTTIAIGTDDFSKYTVRLPDGGVEETLEKAYSGHIMFDENELQHDIRETMMHALTHACKPVETSPIDPFFLPGGARVSGVQGFGVDVTLPNEGKTFFMSIEEGVAEALAVTLGRILNFQYSTKHPVNFALGSLTLEIMEYCSLQPIKVAQMLQKNNLMGFVGAVFGTSKPEPRHLIQLIDWYNAVRKGDDYKTILNEFRRTTAR